MASISCNGTSLVTASGRHLLVVNDGTKEIIEIPAAKKNDGKKKEDNGEDEGTRKNRILASKFSPSGDYFTVGDDDKQLHLFQTKPIWRLISSRSVARRCTSLTFTHNEAEVIVADKTGDVYRFSVKEPENAGTLILGHLSMVLDVLVTPNDQYIVTSDRDEKIRISMFPNAYNIYSFCLGHSEFVSQVTFIEEFSCLVSGSGDGTIRTWDLNGKQTTCTRCQRSEEAEAPIKRLVYDPHLKVLVLAFYKISRLSFYSIYENSGQLEVKWSCDLNLDREPWDIGIDRNKRLWLVQPCEETPVHVYSVQRDADGNIEVTSARNEDSALNLLNTSWDFFKESLDAPDPYVGLPKVTMEKNVEDYLAKKHERLEGKKKEKERKDTEPAEKRIKTS